METVYRKSSISSLLKKSFFAGLLKNDWMQGPRNPEK
jgi:hypothetical protein